MKTIRIIDVPPGDAPEEVRRAWVGMVLPVCDPVNDVWLARGVRTRRPETLEGYAVEGATAILVFHARVCVKLP